MEDKPGIQKPLIIGAHNVFEVGCRVESYAGHIGESNVFECKSFVGPKVIVGSGCVIGKKFSLHSIINFEVITSNYKFLKLLN